MRIKDLDDLLSAIHNPRISYEELRFSDSFDFSKFTDYLRKNKNDYAGVTFLGYSHANELFTPRDYNKASKCYYYACNGGNVKATYYLSELFSDFKSNFADIERAITLVEEAAELNDPSALYQVALLYDHNGIYVVNHQKAFEYYIKAAEYGSLDSMYVLIMKYLKQKDYEKIPQFAKEIIDREEPAMLILKYLNDKNIISLSKDEVDSINKSVYSDIYKIFFEEFHLTLDSVVSEDRFFPEELSSFHERINNAIDKRQDELKQRLNDIDCFLLSLTMQDADDSYNAAKEEKDLNNKKLLFEQALSSYEEAYKLGADYVIDRIEEIKKILKSL